MLLFLITKYQWQYLYKVCTKILLLFNKIKQNIKLISFKFNALLKSIMNILFCFLSNIQEKKIW